MMTLSQIKVNTDLKALNNEIAAQNKEKLHSCGILTVDVLGSPGSGKTTLLENILPELAAKCRVAVIEGDLATENDAQRIAKTGVKAVQINTNGGCHLDAKMIERQFDNIDLENTDVLVIENVGNLVCPVSFALGEDLRIVVLSTAEGEDKPLKYPTAMLKTDAVVVSKTDIAGYVSVSTEKLIENIKTVNPDVKIFTAGKTDGEYRAEGLVDYIIEARKNLK